MPRTVAGESGTGKTQLALYLTLSTLASGGSVVYLSTEQTFPVGRLVQLAQQHGIEPKEMLDNLYLEHAFDLDVQWHVLRYQLPHLLETCCSSSGGTRPVRLLVIDSIAANYRYGNEGNYSGANEASTLLLPNTTPSPVNHSAQERSKQLYQLGIWLKHVSHKYGMMVLSLNQVTGTPGMTEPQPALGNAWSHCVNTRLILTRCSMENGGGGGGCYCGQLRQLRVQFSPCLAANQSLIFQIHPNRGILFDQQCINGHICSVPSNYYPL